MIRICSEVHISDIDTTPTFDKRAFENRLVDAFVKYHLNKGANYEFVCRPDEKHKGSLSLPDYEYFDKHTKQTLLIELSAITYKHATHYESLYKVFLSLCGELTGLLQGIFYIIVPYEKIPQYRVNTLKKRNQYRERLKNIIQEKAVNMSQHESIMLEGGEALMKVDDEGSTVYPISDHLLPLCTEDISFVVDLFTDAADKFEHYHVDGCKNILLLLHRGDDEIRNDINISFDDLKAGIYGKRYCSLPVFTGLYEIYIMCVDIYWDTDITICNCYPKRKIERLCLMSELFKNQKELVKCLEEYFPG